jgi:hypothetical protein
MRRAITVIGWIASVVATAATASAPQPRMLEPTSKWVLGYYDERCALSRDFGSGADSVRLQLDSYGTWASFRLTLSGAAVPTSQSPTGHGSYRFTADPGDREETLLQGKDDKDSMPAVTFGVTFLPFAERQRWDKMSDKERKAEAPHPQPWTDYERTVDTIRVAFGRGRPVELHVGHMDVPLNEMRKCVNEMYKTWGLDAAQQMTLTRFASPLPLAVKRVQQDYPLRQRMNGISAFIPVRLLVDANGAALSCVVQSTAANQDFRAAVCSHLTGKYQPALDASGKPVSSMFQTSVIYLVEP